MDPHFVEIPRDVRDEEVEFLVIVAHALAVHGHVRATLDIDPWVRPTEGHAVWPNRIVAHFGDVAAPVPGCDDVRTAKRAAGRPKDLAYLEEPG